MHQDRNNKGHSKDAQVREGRGGRAGWTATALTAGSEVTAGSGFTHQPVSSLDEEILLVNEMHLFISHIFIDRYIDQGMSVWHIHFKL